MNRFLFSHSTSAKPNLPDKKISYLFCSGDIDAEITSNLEQMNIIPIKLSGLDIFDAPIRNHPDMLCFNIGGNKWIFYKSIYEKNKYKIDKINLDIIFTDAPQRGDYPYNIALNAALLGEYIICTEKYADKLIFEYCVSSTVLNVKQGYAKCSICIVDEKSAITSDISIYKTCIQHEIDVLLIRSGHIDLYGYDYGFIGGCSGLLDKNLLAFTGDITKHPDYDDIKKFCYRKDVKIISLSQKKLYDYGSLLPI